MWPLPRLNNNYITISFHPEQIACALIKPYKQHYRLYAYKKIAYPYPLKNSSLFFALITQELKAFLQAYNLEHSFAAFAIHEPQVTQRLVTFAQANPSYDQFQAIVGGPQVTWQSLYLYPTEEGLFTFYLTTIDHSVLFAYKLLALQLHLNVLTITTPFQTALTLYRYLYGSAFRQVRLALDMKQSHTILESFCTIEFFNRIIDTHSINHFECEKELRHLIPLVGLYRAEQESEWKK